MRRILLATISLSLWGAIVLCSTYPGGSWQSILGAFLCGLAVTLINALIQMKARA